MTDQHPIIPPPELVQQWDREFREQNPTSFIGWAAKHVAAIAARAAQWGADQELEACVEWISKQNWTWTSNQLRAARRPKPPSLKDQALVLIDECTDPEGGYLDDNALSIIRRAVEALPND